MAGSFFGCYKVFAFVNKSEKENGKKKNRKRDKGNEEEGKKSPLDGISAAEGVTIRSVHLGRQYD